MASSFNCALPGWIVRFFAWAFALIGVAFSIETLISCELVQGQIFYYNIFSDEFVPAPTPAPTFGSGLSPTPAPGPAFTAAPTSSYRIPDRDPATVSNSDFFTLGVFRSAGVGDGVVSPLGYASCLSYSVTERGLDPGPAEGASQAFGLLATLLGGAGVLLMLPVMCRLENKIIPKVAGGLLIAASISEILVFSLFASEHCSNGFWDSFLSQQQRDQQVKPIADCFYGAGTRNAMIAIFAFFAAGVVACADVTDAVPLVHLNWGDGAGNRKQQQQQQEEEERKALTYSTPAPAPQPEYEPYRGQPTSTKTTTYTTTIPPQNQPVIEA